MCAQESRILNEKSINYAPTQVHTCRNGEIDRRNGTQGFNMSHGTKKPEQKKKVRTNE